MKSERNLLIEGGLAFFLFQSGILKQKQILLFSFLIAIVNETVSKEVCDLNCLNLLIMKQSRKHYEWLQ